MATSAVYRRVSITGSLRNSLQYNNFQPKVDSNPIADRVRCQRQRLPSNSCIGRAQHDFPNLPAYLLRGRIRCSTSVYRDPAGGFTVGLSATWVLSRAESLPVLNELQADEISAGWILWSELLPKLPASRFQFHLINSGGQRRAIRIDALAIAGPTGRLLPWFHPQDRFALAGLDAVNRRDQPPPLKRICHRETLLAKRTQGKCPQE